MADEAFWSECDDFIFSPENLDAGADVAEGVVALLGLRPGACVLDLGCGPGRVAVPLARRGLRVLGIDLQPSYLERARAFAERERSGSRTSPTSASGVLETRWTVEHRGSVRTFNSRVHTYTASELGDRVRAAGFRNVTYHGTTRGGPPTIDRYEVVILAER